MEDWWAADHLVGDTCTPKRPASSGKQVQKESPVDGEKLARRVNCRVENNQYKEIGAYFHQEE